LPECLLEIACAGNGCRTIARLAQRVIEHRLLERRRQRRCRVGVDKDIGRLAGDARALKTRAAAHDQEFVATGEEVAARAREKEEAYDEYVLLHRTLR
jgi:hypothetical protein